MPVPGILTALLLAVFSLFPRPQAIGPSDIALNAIDSAGSDFDGTAVLANVTDGKLTITAGPGALNPKLCFIEIGKVGTALDAATIARLNNAVAAATARTSGPVFPKPQPNPRTYVYGSYVDEPLMMQAGAGVVASRYFYHANHLYSVAALTDSAGEVVERYSYDAHGRRTVLSPNGVVLGDESSVGNNVGWTGRYLDTETGLWFFRARYFDSGLGRFIGRDPLGYVDGMSLYAGYFVPNGVDPSGYANGLWKEHLPDPVTPPPSNCCGGVQMKTNECCENGQVVKKIAVYAVNRGGKNSGWRGGHIDLIIPGCGSGMVGYFGDQTGIDGDNSVRQTIVGAFTGMPGTMNITPQDWNRKQLLGGRPDYLRSPNDRELRPEINNGNYTGRVISYAPNPRSWISEFLVCPSRAKKMCDKAMQIRSNPGYFSLCGRNCSTRAASVLGAGGVGAGGIQWLDNPQRLQEQLGSPHSFWGYTIYSGSVGVLGDPSDSYAPVIDPNYKYPPGPVP
jgi:RHS repeat-associated protein